MTDISEERSSAGAGQDSSRAFSLQIVIGLLVVGVLSFAAFIVLSAFADDLREPEDGGTHAMSKSTVGFSALVELLKGEGWNVRVSRGALSELKAYNQLTLLTPRYGSSLSEGVLYRTSGDVLVVLPKWDWWGDFDHPGWVRSDGLMKDTDVERLFSSEGLRLSVGHAPGVKDVVLARKAGGVGIPVGKIERLQTLSSSDIEPILTDENGHTILGRIQRDYVDSAPPAPPDDPDEAGQPAPLPPADAPHFTPIADPYQRDIFVLSEPDLLNTKGLASIETARGGLQALAAIVPGKETEIVFDMTLHGFERSRNFLKLLLEPPFLPAVLCMAFAGGLMAVYAIAGRMRVRAGREIALGKAMLVENSALLLSLAGRDAHMGQRYAAMTRALAATAAGVPTRASKAQQAAMLDAVGRADRDAPPYSQLSEELGKAETSTTMLQAANRLFRWRQEIGREHRRR